MGSGFHHASEPLPLPPKTGSLRSIERRLSSPSSLRASQLLDPRARTSEHFVEEEVSTDLNYEDACGIAGIAERRSRRSLSVEEVFPGRRGGEAGWDEVG